MKMFIIHENDIINDVIIDFIEGGIRMYIG